LGEIERRFYLKLGGRVIWLQLFREPTVLSVSGVNQSFFANACLPLTFEVVHLLRV
jgi:hypothetical protein